MAESGKIFVILYAKAGAKKRKIFHDGELHITPHSGGATLATSGSFTVSLKSCEGTELKRSTERNIDAFEVGCEVNFGSYCVQIDSLMAQPLANRSCEYCQC